MTVTADERAVRAQLVRDLVRLGVAPGVAKQAVDTPEAIDVIVRAAAAGRAAVKAVVDALVVASEPPRRDTFGRALPTATATKAVAEEGRDGFGLRRRGPRR